MVGLATGTACCLLIALYVLQENSYDGFHKKADRVRATIELGYNGQVTNVAVTGNRIREI